MRICVRVRETAVLSQQGRLRQSADRQMSVLTTNQNKSMKNTYRKNRFIFLSQYVKQHRKSSSSGEFHHFLTRKNFDAKVEFD